MAIGRSGPPPGPSFHSRARSFPSFACARSFARRSDRLGLAMAPMENETATWSPRPPLLLPARHATVASTFGYPSRRAKRDGGLGPLAAPSKSSAALGRAAAANRAADAGARLDVHVDRDRRAGRRRDARRDAGRSLATGRE